MCAPQSRVLLAVALLCGLAACSGDATDAGRLRIEISHLQDGAPLQLTREPAGEKSFTVSKLRYYVSNVRLRDEKGVFFAVPNDADSSEGYHLIDVALPASQRFDVTGVPPGRYTGLEFLLGVDAARNHAGAQSGALDPAHGLFWSWKTGYIFFALEGHAARSGASGKTITYHLGGDEAARTVFLPLVPKPARVEPNLLPTVHLKADVARLFDTPHAIDVATVHSVMGGPGIAPLADNAAALFAVDHLHHEPLARQ